MAFKFFNIGKANAEIEGATAAIDNALSTAKISTINVDGKVLTLAEAPLAAKIAAFAALAKTGDTTQDVSDLIVSNGQIAAQVEDLTGKLATASALNQALSREKTELIGKLETATASVQTLTAKQTELTQLLDASNKEASRVTSEKLAQDAELSQVCVATGCLILTDAAGKELAKDAPPEQKLAAAKVVPFADKMKAYRGAVNAAIAKTGSTPLEMPSAPPQGEKAKAPEPTGFDRMKRGTKIQGQN